MAICSVEEAVEDIRQGRMIILVDDEDRENEGDITIAAEHVTPEAINFMAKYARGLICLPLGPSLVDKLDLPLMTQRNGSKFGTKFTVSIEARNGVTTGISAADRARTILAAVAGVYHQYRLRGDRFRRDHRLVPMHGKNTHHGSRQSHCPANHSGRPFLHQHDHSAAPLSGQYMRLDSKLFYHIGRHFGIPCPLFFRRGIKWIVPKGNRSL